MTPTLSCSAVIKIAGTDPLAKLGEAQSYWIRIVPDTRSSEGLHAIAAVRCENRGELHWLSAGLSSPAGAVKLMRSGFNPLTEAGLASAIIEELIRNGSATSANAEARVAA